MSLPLLAGAFTVQFTLSLVLSESLETLWRSGAEQRQFKSSNGKWRFTELPLLETLSHSLNQEKDGKALIWVEVTQKVIEQEGERVVQILQ